MIIIPVRKESGKWIIQENKYLFIIILNLFLKVIDYFSEFHASNWVESKHWDRGMSFWVGPSVSQVAPSFPPFSFPFIFVEKSGLQQVWRSSTLNALKKTCRKKWFHTTIQVGPLQNICQLFHHICFTFKETKTASNASQNIILGEIMWYLSWHMNPCQESCKPNANT